MKHFQVSTYILHPYASQNPKSYCAFTEHRRHWPTWSISHWFQESYTRLRSSSSRILVPSKRFRIILLYIIPLVARPSSNSYPEYSARINLPIVEWAIDSVCFRLIIFQYRLPPIANQYRRLAAHPFPIYRFHRFTTNRIFQYYLPVGVGWGGGSIFYVTFPNIEFCQVSLMDR